ncbi:hypothetical protein [Williamsia herbipolensis]|uniref:hypothetical protein n=1 Tax=Williamsia herbipolensis TaxID=1603258 RepID=UPI0005F8821D|nr:hypothetical protein [Williamsia herbipolensis]
MTRSPNLATDMLIETARRSVACHEWVDDRLGEHGANDDLPDETDALADAMQDLGAAVREFTSYSDGRPVHAVEIVDGGIHVHHTFQAVPVHHGERLLFTGPRPTDPDQPDRGHYRVYADDAAATLRVEVYGPLESV